MGIQDDFVSSANRARRLLALSFMLGEDPLRAVDAAAALEVTERTIYRDISALRAAGFAIEGDHGIGYVLPAQPATSPICMTKDELRALVAGAKLVKSGADPVLSKAAVTLLKKVQGL